ncbi:MAG: hypothetical protein ACI9R3_004343 [Verrucomicrobiales bacterium]|jgi:hypothetical protein
MNLLKRFSGIAIAIALSCGLGGCDKGQQQESGLKTPNFVIEESSSAASEENPQIVLGNTFEDFYYAFTLDRPNEEWQFLTGEKAAQISPDAVMAMVSTKSGAFAMVLAESMEDIDLKDYSDLILSPDSILGAKGDPATEGMLGNRPAVLKETPAMIAGTPFRYRVAITQRGKFFYQILGWAIETNYVHARSEIEGIVSSFRTIDGREPSLRANLATEDANGFGWQIVDGVYSNAAGGYRINNVAGCRLMGQAELARVNANAAAGLSGGFGEFYQLWMVEHSDDPESLTEYHVQSWVKELGGELGQRLPVKVGELDAIEISITNVVIGSIAFKYRMAWLVRGGQVFRVVSWWQSENEQRALELLAGSYQAVEWLDEKEMLLLTQDLGKRDPGNAVGIDFSMRNGVFRDFSGGYQLALERKFFETITSAQQQLDDRLRFTNLYSSAFFEVDIDRTDLGQHARHHREIVADLNHGTTETLTIGKHEFLATAYTSKLNGLNFVHYYVSNVDREQVFQMRATHSGGDENGLRQEISKILDGFERPEKLIAVQRDAASFVDHRLGYSVTIPTGWKIDNLPLGDANAMGSAVMLERGESACLAIALCSPHGLDLDLATLGMLENIGVQFDGADEVVGTGKLGGLPAKRKTLKGQLKNETVTVFVWTTRRAHSGFIFAIVDADSIGAAGAEKLATSMQLIP